MNQPRVRVGQVRADNDTRSEGRTVRVDKVDARYAYCTVLTAATPGGPDRAADPDRAGTNAADEYGLPAPGRFAVNGELYRKLLTERYGPLDRLEAERFPPAVDLAGSVTGAGEEQWRRQVRDIATRYGWRLQYHTADSRRSDPGWPDEVFGHLGRRRTLFVEFKTDTGRIRPAQREWLAHLADSGLEVAVWRPCDLPTVLRVLGPAQERATLPANFRRPAS